jgi:segregation and condensation protein B
MEAGLVQILEGALLAAGEPLSVQRMALLFEENDRPSKEEIRAAIQSVEERCEDRGYELVQVASGYRFQVRQDLATWVGRLWQERPARYSRALMETLSLIAYRQPITRGEIEEIRGVAVSTNIIKTLLEREWVRVVGAPRRPGPTCHVRNDPTVSRLLQPEITWTSCHRWQRSRNSITSLANWGSNYPSKPPTLMLSLMREAKPLNPKQRWKTPQRRMASSRN